MSPRLQSVGLLVVCLACLQSTALGQSTEREAVSDAVRDSGVFPAGTRVIDVQVSGSSIQVALSAEAAPKGLGDAQVDAMTSVVVDALRSWPQIVAFELTVAGRPLWQYLPKGGAPEELGGGMQPQAGAGMAATAGTTELAGKLVMLHPSHGSYWDQSVSYWRRAMRTFCGPNPATNRPPGWAGSTYQPSDYYYWTMGYQWPSFYEDDMSPETIRFLMKYVESSGAEVWVSRNLDKNAGNFDYAGYGYPNCSFPLPKWQTAAKYYLQDRGDVPEWVWNEPALSAQSDKDIRARPYYANYRMAEKFPGQDQGDQSVWGNCVSLHLHSNAAGSGNARGTETFWYTSIYTYLQAESTRLAGNINGGAVNAIRNHYDGLWADAMYVAGTSPPPEFPPGSTYYGYQHGGGSTTQWQNRGVKTTNFGEIREAKMPAVLCELVFHDDWKWYPDHVFMLDQIFRATVAWGFYEGICNQFGVTPKPRLAAAVASVDFPAFVPPGSPIQGSITMQNNGMAWCWGHKFTPSDQQYAPYTVWKLKATASDQFAPGTKIAIASDAVVYPGETTTFAVNLTAPATPGLYATQWRMLKDDARGGDFGAAASAQIRVCSAPPGVGNFDADCDVDAADLGIFRDCTTGPERSHAGALPPACSLVPNGSGVIAADFDGDGDVDMDDFGVFQRCYGGADQLVDANCAD